MNVFFKCFVLKFHLVFSFFFFEKKGKGWDKVFSCLSAFLTVGWRFFFLFNGWLVFFFERWVGVFFFFSTVGMER